MRRMGIVTAFFRGWGVAIGNPGYVLLKWLLNIAFAVIIAAPLMVWLNADLTQSTLGTDLGDKVDVLFLFEFLRSHADGLSALSFQWFGFAALFALLNIYLTGGILEAYDRDAPMPWGTFFSACGRHFFALVLVGIICFVLLIGAVFFPLALWEKLLEATARDWFRSPKWYDIFHWAGMFFIFVFFFSWVARVYDYARVMVCREDSVNPFTAIFRAITFTLFHRTKTILLWFLYIGMLFVFVWGFDLLENILGDWALGHWPLLLIGQIFILLRIANGLASLAGQMLFLRSYQKRETGPTPAPTPAREPDDSETQTPEHDFFQEVD